MNSRLLLTIIRHVTLNSVDPQKIAEETHIPINIVIRNIHDLSENDLLTFTNDTFTATFDQRIQLAIYAIQERIDIEKVCRAIGWREFEDLVIVILEQNDFQTMKHVRFKSPLRRYEIDILAFRNSLLLSIDCKRWKRSWQKTATIRMIHAQVERTQALIQSFSTIKTVFKIPDLKKIGFIPLIVTLSETPYQIYEKIAVVPIFHLQNFLEEMNIHLDKLRILKTS